MRRRHPRAPGTPSRAANAPPRCIQAARIARALTLRYFCCAPRRRGRGEEAHGATGSAMSCIERRWCHARRRADLLAPLHLALQLAKRGVVLVAYILHGNDYQPIATVDGIARIRAYPRRIGKRATTGRARSSCPLPLMRLTTRMTSTTPSGSTLRTAMTRLPARDVIRHQHVPREQRAAEQLREAECGAAAARLA